MCVVVFSVTIAIMHDPRTNDTFYPFRGVLFLVFCLKPLFLLFLLLLKSLVMALLFIENNISIHL